MLPAEPRLLAARTVRDARSASPCARPRRGRAIRFDAILDPLGLSHLQARSPGSLAFAEQRAVELALAVSTPAPVLLALHEPLADVALPRLDVLPLRLREAAATGACVVITTSSPADARALADHVVVLHKGVIAREARGGAGLVLGDEVTLRAWIEPRAPGSAGDAGDATPGARALVAALALRPEVRAVSFREVPGEPSVVEVRGDHAEACALAVIESALAIAGVEIEAPDRGGPGPRRRPRRDRGPSGRRCARVLLRLPRPLLPARVEKSAPGALCVRPPPASPPGAEP